MKKIIISASRDFPSKNNYRRLVSKSQIEGDDGGPKMAGAVVLGLQLDKANHEKKLIFKPGQATPFERIKGSDANTTSVEFIAHGFDIDIGKIAVLEGDGYKHPYTGNSLVDGDGNRIKDSNGRYLDAGPWIEFTPAEIAKFFNDNAKEGNAYKFSEITLCCCNSEKFAKALATQMPGITVNYFKVPIYLDANGVVRAEQTKHQEDNKLPGDIAEKFTCRVEPKVQANMSSSSNNMSASSSSNFYNRSQTAAPTTSNMSSSSSNQWASSAQPPRTIYMDSSGVGHYSPAPRASSSSPSRSAFENQFTADNFTLGLGATTTSASAMPVRQKESSLFSSIVKLVTRPFTGSRSKSESDINSVSSDDQPTINNPARARSFSAPPRYIAPDPNAKTHAAAIEAYRQRTNTPDLEDTSSNSAKNTSSSAPRPSGPGQS